uniref:RNA helicase n=1 Tax=Echinostoma caproni TaxID=27848 RepID=A0A183ALK7_9TREM
LDPLARNEAIKQFTANRIRVLLVTDVAARGVDIPLLDNVINFHFPPQPKLFLHRVGRVARAGRSGMAYSLIDPDELPYLLDVFVFLGRSLEFTFPENGQPANDSLGRPPRTLTSNAGNLTQQLITTNANLTIFEAMGRDANPEAFDMMMKKRKLHESLIAEHAARQIRLKVREANKPEIIKRTANLSGSSAPLGTGVNEDEDDLQNTDLFVPYFRGNEAQERGLSVGVPGNQFAVDAANASLDLLNDEHSQTIHPVGYKKRKLVWDRRRKRFVDSEAAEGKANLKRIKTESGVWIPASYKTDKYTQWLKRTQVDRVSAEAAAANEETDDQAYGTTTTFSARFGGVVEFPDEPKENAKISKRQQNREAKSSRDSKKTGSTGNGNSDGGEKRDPGFTKQPAGIQVLGTKPWFKRAEAKQHRRARAAAEAQKIRQPKGSRTFGQLRRPEQVLKQKRLRAKQQMKKKHKGQKPGGKRHGPPAMGRKKAPFKRRK